MLSEHRRFGSFFVDLLSRQLTTVMERQVGRGDGGSAQTRIAGREGPDS